MQHISKPINRVMANVVRQHQAEHLHNLGPRPVLEALLEIGNGADLDEVLDRYQRLHLDTVKAVGGDSFNVIPLHPVTS